jgi:hypothetical protein
MRNEIDAFKNSFSIEVYNKIKDIKSIADSQFTVDKERLRTNKMIEELKRDLDEELFKSKT